VSIDTAHICYRLFPAIFINPQGANLMAKLNRTTRATPVHTHEGAVADRSTALAKLQRAVASCMLWEKTFYEDGESIADRIEGYVKECNSEQVGLIAIQARTEHHLRHVPLLLAVGLARKGYKGTADVIFSIIQRADELTEFVSIYWKNGKVPLSAQVKKGLARAFTKFDAYQLAKYNRDTEIKLRDVLFLCHAKPKDETQEADWKNLVEGTLATPDTWETNLSAGEDKGETFTRLLKEKKLGFMALLRNLRNMDEADVDPGLINKALRDGAAKGKALPFRFISAVKHAPKHLTALDESMQLALGAMDRMPGKTVICVDVSGSMGGGWGMSAKSNVTPRDAAAGIAILCRGIMKDCRIVGFGTQAQEIPAYAGLAIADKLSTFGNTVGHGTNIGLAVEHANRMKYDRLIVITDMQSHDSVALPLPGTKAYIINCAAYENGIGYGRFTHINGFSESVVKYMREIENISDKG
jgi:60 kDa SS-A/Ro ribonucleoprotein